MYNPIIPVNDIIPDVWKTPPFPDPTGLKIARGYLDFFEPDVFVEAESGLATQIGIADEGLDLGHPRILPLDAFFASKDDLIAMPLGLNIFRVYKDVYEREFKFVHRHERPIVFFEDGSSDTNAFIEATFGGFPNSGPLKSISQSYNDAFGPERLSPGVENWVKVMKEGYQFPLQFTIRGIQRDLGGGSDPVIFVADPTSSPDLLDLWNIRQFYSHVLPVNIQWLTDCRDFLIEFIKVNHRPIPGNPYGTMIYTTVQFGRSISKERAETVTKESHLDELPPESWILKLGYDHIWQPSRSDLVRESRRARISAKSSDLELTVSKDGDDAMVRFPTLSPDFTNTYDHGPARWVNVLKFRGYGTAETLALTLPSSFTGDLSARMRMGDLVIVSREGFVLPQEFREGHEYLRLMTGRQAIIEWLRRNGVTAEASDPGRIADQVLDALGGLWRVGLIADRETLELLDKMAKSVRQYSDGTVEEFPDRTVDVKKWKDLVARLSNKPFSRGLSLESFIKADILRLGISIQCPNCMKKNWYGLDSLREQVLCERCLKQFDFPQGSLDFKNTPWQYRVIGPFSVPNYASGAYATALALRVFHKTLTTAFRNLTYSTGLEFKIENEKPFEVDFTLWYQRERSFDRDEEPVLVFGETKSFATECFKNEDVTRMAKLAERFPGAFLVFATMKDSLSDNEREDIGGLTRWGRELLDDGRPRAPVIVLTGTEIFAHWHIQTAWKNRGGMHAQLIAHPSVRLDNLWTFADLTQQVYLGLPDWYSEWRQKTSQKPLDPSKK
jgi:hypothetical protein